VDDFDAIKTTPGGHNQSVNSFKFSKADEESKKSDSVNYNAGVSDVSGLSGLKSV